MFVFFGDRSGRLTGGLLRVLKSDYDETRCIRGEAHGRLAIGEFLIWSLSSI